MKCAESLEAPKYFKDTRKKDYRKMEKKLDTFAFLKFYLPQSRMKLA